MQPQNNVQNGVPVAPQPVKTAPVVPQPATAAPVKGEPKKDNLFENAPKKKGKGMLLGLVFCILLAAGGIAFGVWTMMDSKSQKDSLNEQISALKTQNNGLLGEIADIKNSVSNKISFYSKIIILHLQEVQRYGKRFERHQDLLMHQQVC